MRATLNKTLRWTLIITQHLAVKALRVLINSSNSNNNKWLHNHLMAVWNTNNTSNGDNGNNKLTKLALIWWAELKLSTKRTCNNLSKCFPFRQHLLCCSRNWRDSLIRLVLLLKLSLNQVELSLTRELLSSFQRRRLWKLRNNSQLLVMESLRKAQRRCNQLFKSSKKTQNKLMTNVTDIKRNSL